MKKIIALLSTMFLSGCGSGSETSLIDIYDNGIGINNFILNTKLNMTKEQELKNNLVLLKDGFIIKTIEIKNKNNLKESMNIYVDFKNSIKIITVQTEVDDCYSYAKDEYDNINKIINLSNESTDNDDIILEFGDSKLETADNYIIIQCSKKTNMLNLLIYATPFKDDNENLQINKNIEKDIIKHFQTKKNNFGK